MPLVATCGPNEVLVISGCFKSEPQFIHGGRAFVWPGLQKVQRMSVNTLTLTPDVKNKLSKDLVPINISAVCQLRIMVQNNECLKMAVENFLSKSEEEIKGRLLGTCEGKLDAVISRFTAEDIKYDPRSFNNALYEELASELINFGVGVVSVTTKKLTDDNEFFKRLALKKIEEAEKKQEEAGNINSRVSQYSKKLTELNQQKEEGKVPEKTADVKEVEINVDSDKVETTYQFKQSTSTEDLYKGYDWGTELDRKTLIEK